MFQHRNVCPTSIGPFCSMKSFAICHSFCFFHTLVTQYSHSSNPSPMMSDGPPPALKDIGEGLDECGYWVARVWRKVKSLQRDWGESLSAEAVRDAAKSEISRAKFSPWQRRWKAKSQHSRANFRKWGRSLSSQEGNPGHEGDARRSLSSQERNPGHEGDERPRTFEERESDEEHESDEEEEGQQQGSKKVTSCGEI